MKECMVCTTIALRRKYITIEDEISLRNKLVELAKMNSGLSKSIKSEIQFSKKPSTPNPVLQTPN